jgi:hypothetical protein
MCGVWGWARAGGAAVCSQGSHVGRKVGVFCLRFPQGNNLHNPMQVPHALLGTGSGAAWGGKDVRRETRAAHRRGVARNAAVPRGT